MEDVRDQEFTPREDAKMYRVPKNFIEDHWDRDCGETDRLVRETSKHYFVELDQSGYSDLLSDADVYVDGGVGEFGMEFFGLIASAKATKDALIKVGWQE